MQTSVSISRITVVPGIHFTEVRARIALADVLDLLGFVPCESSGDQVRGPCPVHHSISPLSRSFSAHLRRHIYKCFKCGSCGNQLDLYAASTGLSLFEATIDLCEKLHREVPWMLNGTSPQPRLADRLAPQPRNTRGLGQRGCSVPESDQTDRAATAPLVPTGLPKWCPF
jgi:CHC2 zinc finger